jgi:alkaline phosphatase D
MEQKKKDKLLPPELKERLNLLSPRERDYFRMMWPKSGVLYLTSKPGIAKSAILRDIAAKMDFNYIDIRLSMRDETDVGLFPYKVEIDGKFYLDFMTPLWAKMANNKFTIIHFEELNRAGKSVRDAALQLLLDRIIGSEFKFNDNVLMCASGNLGEEDNTDVDDFDGALNNRLIHVRHTLEVDEWLDNFAYDNIHKSICDFIKSKPTYMYRDPKDENGNKANAYASPRTWEFLSDYIISNDGCECDVEEFIEDVIRLGYSYVGSSINEYIKFIKNKVEFTIEDVINRYPKIEPALKKANRDRITDLIQNLKKISLEKLKADQVNNIHLFLNIMGDDEKVDYINHFIESGAPGIGLVTKGFLQKYPDIIAKLYEVNTKKNEVSELTIRKKTS